jgi:EAL domain-containing protein (putative c-di-GMP-specific phosphodiesterase class I)
MLTIEEITDAPADVVLNAPPAVRRLFDTPGLFCSVTPFFQPIVKMDGREVIGYEALSRGPHGTPLFAARTLFATARSMGELPALERACWTAALLAAHRAGIWKRESAKLFLNLSPERMQEAEFVAFARRLIDDTGVDPRRIVVEVTEDSGSRDHARFLKAADAFRAIGFGIAVDDLGAGYADLCAVAELRPDYLKIDRRLIRGVHAHVGRQHVLTALVALARATGATAIAEGIELPEEMDAVRAAGIEYVQGFLLAPPARSVRALRPVARP